MRHARIGGRRIEESLVRDAGVDGALEGVVDLEDHALGAVVAVARLVVARNLSVRETEKILASSVIVRKRNTKELRRSPLSDVEERLQKRLGTKVSVLNGKRGGKVIIHYFSPAELDGILEQLLQ